MTEEQRFRGAIDQSRDSVLHVAKNLQRHGEVTLPLAQMRPTFEERDGYGDDYDLGFNQRRVEIKGRGLAFTSANDFPYPTVFVDRVVKADKSSVVYVSLSRDGKFCAVIHQETRSQWIKSDRHDTVKGYGLEVYECPKDAVVFCKIEDLGALL